MRCPNCENKNVGKIGAQQYFCWNCCIELTVEEGKLDIHQIEEDGTLSSLNDLFYPQGS